MISIGTEITNAGTLVGRTYRVRRIFLDARVPRRALDARHTDNPENFGTRAAAWRRASKQKQQGELMRNIWTLLREIAWLPVFALVCGALAVVAALVWSGDVAVALGALAVTLAVLNLRA